MSLATGRGRPCSGAGPVAADTQSLASSAPSSWLCSSSPLRLPGVRVASSPLSASLPGCSGIGSRVISLNLAMGTGSMTGAGLVPRSPAASARDEGVTASPGPAARAEGAGGRAPAGWPGQSGGGVALPPPSRAAVPNAPSALAIPASEAAPPSEASFAAPVPLSTACAAGRAPSGSAVLARAPGVERARLRPARSARAACSMSKQRHSAPCTMRWLPRAGQ
mmetsp:Transcript_120444/g.341255  ORF Transcript_120444/g.341255 Transcript_120444/m.341255 type:complete len:222 (-) Transcript_120444:123-788(-)